MRRLSLALLGPMQITLDGQPVGGFAYNKARALLAYLAAEAGRPHHRDTLATLLWPDMPDEAARHNLRQALANLRTAIGDARAMPPFLLITRDSMQFNPRSDYDLDVAPFTALLTTCETHAHRHLERCRSCVARMEQAIALYRGDFLAEFSVGDSAPFEEWQLRHRERLHQQALDTLTRLADYHERRGDGERTRHFAQCQIELEPWREEAHRQLMRLLARDHQRSAALAQYEICRRILERDLGVQPEAETTTLYERIRDGEPRTKNGHPQGQPRTELPRQTPLPIPPTPLIGRETELVELWILLENPACRLITIAGPGGIGKTRLALAAAAEQAETFTDGAAFVPLQATSSAAFVAPAILAALDVPLQGQRDPREQLLDTLRGKELLLVLDNFEQLLAPELGEDEGGTALLTDVLLRAPDVTLLVTSRERLALPGEWLFDLRGLSYPPGELTEGIEGYDAVQLFVQRAGQVRRQFALVDGEAHAVARLCRLVEGLPLAIELAAAALRTRSCTAIVEAIKRDLSALSTVLRGIPERHRSIRATFEHSWRLLSHEERQVFARLSVFRGGFNEEAAVQVARATAELLATLLDKSLLRWDGTARYDMHELVRQYADEKLEQAGEARSIRNHHGAYYLALAETAAPQLHLAEQQSWLARLEAEHSNLRAALVWGQTADIKADFSLQLATVLGEFWEVHGYMHEGRAWLSDALTRMPEPLLLRARALNALGYLTGWSGVAPTYQLFEESLAIGQALGDKQSQADALFGLFRFWQNPEDSSRPYDRLMASLALYRELGDKVGSVRALHYWGYTVGSEGDYQRGSELCEEALALARELGDVRSCANVLHAWGRIARAHNDPMRAQAYLQESLNLYRNLSDQSGMPWSLLGLADVAQLQGDYGWADTLLNETIALCRRLGINRLLAWGLLNLGDIVLYQGDASRASTLFAEGLARFQEYEAEGGIALCLLGFAGVASATSQGVRAAQLCGAVDTFLESVGIPIESFLPLDDRIHYYRTITAIRAQLDDATFAAAWAAGRALALEQAIAYALEGVDITAASLGIPSSAHEAV